VYIEFFTADNPCSDRFLSGYRRKARDNEAGLGKDNDAICEKLKCTKYDTKYQSFRLQILMLMEKRCNNVYSMKILAADSMKLNELKRNLETVCAEGAGKMPEFFHIKLNEFKKQNKHFKNN
jgi:hypothetical protein